MRNVLARALLSIIACVAASGAARADCDRHIYNNTNCPWYVYVQSHGYGSTSVGGACVECGVPIDVRNVGTVSTCRIAPKCAGTISYNGTLLPSAASIYVGTSGNSYLQFDFNSPMPLICPALQGYTGYIARINNPADGDITIFAGCPSPPGPPRPPQPRPPCRLGIC